MNRPLAIHGATIVTGDDAGTLYVDGALLVDSGTGSPRWVPRPICSRAMQRPSRSMRAAAVILPASPTLTRIFRACWPADL